MPCVPLCLTPNCFLFCELSNVHNIKAKLLVTDLRRIVAQTLKFSFLLFPQLCDKVLFIRFFPFDFVVVNYCEFKP